MSFSAPDGEAASLDLNISSKNPKGNAIIGIHWTNNPQYNLNINAQIEGNATMFIIIIIHRHQRWIKSPVLCVSV